MIKCTTVGIEPSELCEEICVLAHKCGALKAWRSRVKEIHVKEKDDGNLEVTLKRGNETIKFTNVVVAPAPTENDDEDSTESGE